MANTIFVSPTSIIVEITDPNEKTWDALTQLMTEVNKGYDAEIRTIAKELHVSMSCASDVWYLRTRSRWSSELELRLIQEHVEGKKINIFEWPER